ncbi:hypothetical protein [Chryseolinea lacunae]|uniref:DUF2946 domain-containing protein n=1 Tax=Chryseolinea lacunae TaxID=2801331 RepID=A0ABS1KNR5_9BACT|nr:hypothetical protein [Chryseolinea lacunae]MBL0740332.1 hypothetical protein [Chryseolinea lacunae]
MKGIQNHNGTNILATLKSGCVLLWLLLYGVGSLSNEGIHAFFHNNEVALHTVQEEKDPCHRNIFHQDNKSCEHKTHVAKLRKCPLCQFSFHADQWLSQEAHTDNVEFVSAVPMATCVFLWHTSALQLPSRAPPVLS